MFRHGGGMVLLRDTLGSIHLLLGERVGVHFAVEVASGEVKLAELQDYAWVDHHTQRAQYSPRIPGIDNHLFYIQNQLEQLGDAAWRPLEQYDLLAKRFHNQ